MEQKREKAIVIFQYAGRNVAEQTHLKDTLPIAESIAKEGWYTEIVAINFSRTQQIYESVKDRFCAYLSRVPFEDYFTPSNNLKANEMEAYKNLLIQLRTYGLIGMPDHQTMRNFGAKDISYRLQQTGLVSEDCNVYYTIDSFRENFPLSLSCGERILKKNHGSFGIGVWRVLYNDKMPILKGTPLPLGSKIICIEAEVNRIHHEWNLGQFMTYCERYIRESQGIVDLKFLPRVAEGELKMYLAGEIPLYVLHKTPKNQALCFSTNGVAGAVHQYYDPAQLKPLVNYFSSKLSQLKKALGEKEVPLIWTADFILDTNEDGSDRYILNQINCECLSLANQLHRRVQDVVAKEATRMILASQSK